MKKLNYSAFDGNEVMSMNIVGVGFQTTHDKDFSITRPHGYGEMLLIYAKTRAFHVINGKTIIIEPNTAILYDESTYQHYGALDDIYIDDWVHFHLENDEKKKLLTGIQLNNPILVSDTDQFAHIIRAMSVEMYSMNQGRKVTCNLYLSILLNKLSESCKFIRDRIDDTMYNKLIWLRADIYNNPQLTWTISDMAQKIGLSESYFQHMYKKTFQMSVMNDVIESRIERSKLLLTSTELSVKEIAERCGYQYDIYFMRQFKKRVGMTALKYRKERD